MPEVLVLQHNDSGGPSGFTEVLDARRTSIAPWRLHHVPGPAPLPEVDDTVAGIVVLGGTMSAVDPASEPWMPDEIELLRRAVTAEIPVLGVCLGAQLLARAFGGDVVKREVPELGFLPLVRTDTGREDPVTGGWPDGAAALFVHEDEVVTLPEGARPLMAGNDGVPAWSLDSAVAVQFHPELTADLLAVWADSGGLDGLAARAGVDLEAFMEEAWRRNRITVALGRALVGRFLDGPVRTRVSGD